MLLSCHVRLRPRAHRALLGAAVIAATAVAVLVLAEQTSAQTDAGSWPQRDGDAQMTRAGVGAGPADPGLRWFTDLDDAETDLAPEGYDVQGRSQQPTLAPDGRVLVIARNNGPSQDLANSSTLVALEADSGEIAWEAPGVRIGTDPGHRCTQAVDSQGRIWVDYEDDDGFAGLQAIDADGEVLDDARIDGARECRDSHLRVGGAPEHLVSVGGRGGSALAAYDVTGDVPSESFDLDLDQIDHGGYVAPGDLTHVAFRDGSLYVVLVDETTADDPTLELVEVSLGDGTVTDALELPVEPDEDGDGDAGDISRVELARPDADSLIVGLARGSFGDARGSLLRVDLSDMTLAWSDPYVSGRDPDQLVIGDGVVVTRFSGDIRRRGVSLSDGSEVWRDEAPRGNLGGSAWRGLVGDADGATYASEAAAQTTNRELVSVDAGGDQRWAIPPGAITAAAEDEHGIPEPSLSSHLEYGPIAADGTLYVRGHNQSTVVAIDDSGGLLAPPDEPDDPVQRNEGAGRFETAEEISKASFDPGVDVAYVATGEDFPDALAGGVPAALNGAPLLLAQSGAVPEATARELDRLDPGRIVLLGGTGVLDASVEGSMANFTDGPVDRLSGSTRFTTATAISEAAFPGGTDRALLATGTNFPDALAGGPLGSVAPGPILLATGDSVPSATLDELNRLDVDTVTVLGGEGAISSQVAAEIEQATGATVERLAGAGRFATAVDIGEEVVDVAGQAGTPVSTLFFATGGAFPDALAGGAVAGAAPGPVLLVSGDSVPGEVVSLADDLADDVDRIVIFGGTAAVSSSVEAELTTLFVD